MMNDPVVIKEEAAIDHVATYEPNSLRVSWKELKEAPIGQVWSVKEQDRWPNGSEYWTETYTKIYEEEDGCLVKHHVPATYYGDADPEETEKTTLIWFEWR